MKKIFTLIILSFFIGVWAYADPMSGTYKVGTGETYTTLKAIFDDINTNGVGGDIVIEITSDLTEAANIGLGVNTNSYSITIRPDADADRTVTFTQTADNTSPTGHFVIGYLGSGLTLAWDDANTIATSNVTIDGYAVGGSTRRLKFTNSTATSLTNARVIVVVGACQNTVIKNCTIENNTTHIGSPFCVGAVVRKGTAIDVAPTNYTIENNIINSLGNNVSMGMRFTNSGTPTSTISGLVIKDNVITSRRRLIEINYTNGAEISGNTFETRQTGAPGTISYGLWTSTAVTGTVNIFNNKFIKAFTEETGAFGHRVVSLSSGATYNIYNNTFAGLDKTKASTVALNMVYLFYSGVAGKIYNNTFYMPQLTNSSSTGYYNAIQLSGNTAEIKNNIFISDEGSHANTSFIHAVPTPATDYNIYYLRKSNAGAKFVATYTTLAAYQSANPTKDVNSKSVDVNFTNTATGDLTLTGASVRDANLAVPRLASVLKDILGTDRAEKTYAGAHEAALPFNKTFTVTAPQGTEHVYITGSFAGKSWDENDPYELAATGNPNEFAGTFPADDDIAYKYLSGKGNWDYQESSGLGGTEYDSSDPSPVKPSDGSNRTYNASDNVTYWKAVPKLTFNATIKTGGVPTELFVKGGWDGWTTPFELTKNESGVWVGSVGNGTSSVIYSNTGYKYYTNDMVDNNYETHSGNRWSIYPKMGDDIQGFETPVTIVGFNNTNVKDIVIKRTSTGIIVPLDGDATIELYSVNGNLIEQTTTSGSYQRDLPNGIYVLRVNGKSVKFVR